MNTMRLFVLLGVVGVAALSIAACLGLVDFTPQVSPKFFFSSDDPQLRAQQHIVEQFEQPTQIILSVKGSIQSPEHLQHIRSLTKALLDLSEVGTVLSLTRGPRSVQDAMESPFWRRILINQDGQASNLLAFVPETVPPAFIAQLEAIIDQFRREQVQVIMSGIPYIVELMRRDLMRDLQVFSVLAIAIFGTLMLVMVRSIRLVIGMLATCLTAGAWTLLVTNGLSIRVGLLTANLATIVFTLTLSHLVFMTFNWRYLSTQAHDESGQLVREALRMTFVPSFWSMATTLLGFVSLFFVEAEPLRRLGVSGSIGTLVAFASAYLLYPWVLRSSHLPHTHHAKSHHPRLLSFEAWLTRRHLNGVAAVLLCCLFAAAGIGKLHKDPSLLSYFSPGNPLREGLEYVDRNLGSSPLTIVVKDPRGGTFTSTQTYQRLWELHLAFEQHPTVGSVVSLPLVMAEARRVPLIGGWLPWNWLLELMDSPAAHRIGNFFINDDRTQGLFLLLMRESGRQIPRTQILTQFEEMVRTHGFEPHLIGGVYVLQGRLAELVVSSLMEGLVLLGVLFAFMAYGLARSWRIAAAIIGSIALIPLWMLGIIGHFRVPFDVISAPAANLAIGMGVDSMIHLLAAARRAARRGPIDWNAWVKARHQQWRAIACSTLVVCAGFGIFWASTFPPTQRFGLSIVLGTAMVPLAALLVLPTLACPAPPASSTSR